MQRLAGLGPCPFGDTAPRAAAFRTALIGLLQPQLFHETKLLNSALQRGPVRPCRGPDGTGPSTPIMAATPVAVSATVAPDSHHEHGLQVTVFSEAHDRWHLRALHSSWGHYGHKARCFRTLQAYPGVCLALGCIAVASGSSRGALTNVFRVAHPSVTTRRKAVGRGRDVRRSG